MVTGQVRSGQCGHGTVEHPVAVRLLPTVPRVVVLCRQPHDITKQSAHPDATQKSKRNNSAISTDYELRCYYEVMNSGSFDNYMYMYMY